MILLALRLNGTLHPNPGCDLMIQIRSVSKILHKKVRKVVEKRNSMSETH